MTAIEFVAGLTADKITAIKDSWAFETTKELAPAISAVEAVLAAQAKQQPAARKRGRPTDAERARRAKKETPSAG